MIKLTLIALSAFALTADLFASGRLSVDESQHATTVRSGERTLWTYHHDPEEGKPFFHPLSTANGTVLTDLRPEDHPWHRGLWFSWKFVDGLNYWEEDRETGLSEGRTVIYSVTRSVSASHTVAFALKLSYRPAPDANPVLRETRNITVQPPDRIGSYSIEWTSTWEPATKDLLLDRTPIPGEPDGKAWGGYAGLSFRMTQDLKGGVFLNSEGLQNAAAESCRARWVSYTPQSGATVVFMDHPDNLRYPSTWYISPEMNFFSPSPLYGAPYRFTESEPLSLRYKIVIAATGLTAEEIESLWNDWIR